MADNEMNNMEEDIIVFEDEEGNEYNYTVVDYMFYNGDEYALLVEATDEEPEDEKQEKIKEGMQLFIDYYRDLWIWQYKKYSKQRQ